MQVLRADLLIDDYKLLMQVQSLYSNKAGKTQHNTKKDFESDKSENEINHSKVQR